MLESEYIVEIDNESFEQETVICKYKQTSRNDESVYIFAYNCRLLKERIIY